MGIIILLTANACAPSCSNDDIQAEASPDMEFVAHKFSRNCGATTKFNVQVSIDKLDRNPSGTGNAFIADGGGKPRISIPIDRVHLSWSQGSLLVRYDKNLRIFKQEKQIKGVPILYESF
jgi:hypothetical protein